MKVAVYYNGDSLRELALADALAKGFHNLGDQATKIDVEHYGEPIDAQMAVVIGWTQGKIFRDYQRAGRHVLMITPGFIMPDRYYRFALDALHSSWSNPDTERARDLVRESGWSFEPARTDLNHYKSVCYVGIAKDYGGWLGLEPIRTYDINCCTRILKNLPLEYKSLFWAAKEPVPEGMRLPRRCLAMTKIHTKTLIENSSCLVSHGQPELVIGLLNGTPVIDMSEEDLRPIPGLPYDETQVKTTRNLNDGRRWQALGDVASREFNLQEIASGKALETLTPHTVKRLERSIFAPNSREYLIEQYRLMHENPRMYRGGLHDDVLLEMSGLVTTFSPQTLLDYGSGKGRQYTMHKQHRTWGGPEPTCYDPGYEPYAEPPKQKFDGVLCTDVAEHIPEESVPEFIRDVLNYATRFVLLSIATWPAKKTIPDGRNAHLTVQPPDWWVTHIVEELKNLSPTEETAVVEKKSETKWVVHYGRKTVVALFEELKKP